MAAAIYRLTPRQRVIIGSVSTELRQLTHSLSVLTEIRDVLWPEGLDHGSSDSDSWTETEKYIAALMRANDWGPEEHLL